MELKKILIPNDFSDCAINAIHFARDIAVRSGAELVFLTTNPIPMVHADPLAVDMTVIPVHDQIEKQTDQLYQNIMRSIDLYALTHSIIKSNTSFMDAIEDALQANDIDLIVTGTHDQHNIFDRLFGSHSVQLIQYCKIPVLMIPENASKVSFNKIGIALNFQSGEGWDHLDTVRLFCQIYGSEVFILNSAKEGRQLFIYDDEKVSLSQYLGTIKHSFFTIKEQSDISDHLIGLCDELKLDALYMHPRNHGLLEGLLKSSRTNAVAMRIKIPLLTMHE